MFLGGKDMPRRDLYRLPGLSAAIGRLRDAVQAGEPVTVYGDFDVDGITSTATITEAVNDLGGSARPYIPNREREGYGLNIGAIESIAAGGAKVLVTCDCGTTNVIEIGTRPRARPRRHSPRPPHDACGVAAGDGAGKSQAAVFRVPVR